MKTTLKEEFPSIIDVAYSEYKKHKHVSEIMSTELKYIEQERTMLEAAKIMGEHHIGSLLVKGQERPLGIVTERDLLTRVIAADKKPNEVRVFDVYSPRLVTIRPQATIREAARTMIKQKGKLVVTEDRKAVGIVTASDLIKSLPEAPETTVLVKYFMTRKVRTVDPEEKIVNAAKIMGKERIGSLIVTKEGKPWGIFTERDLLSKVIYKEVSLEEEVQKFASSPLITIESDWSIHRAAMLMASRHVRRLPVLEDGELSGIITARDLVEAYSM
ncbi:MAG: CBS domain-containing protein [Candidatus Methanosuratincola petrocarbonis]